MGWCVNCGKGGVLETKFYCTNSACNRVSCNNCAGAFFAVGSGRCPSCGNVSKNSQPKAPTAAAGPAAAAEQPPSAAQSAAGGVALLLLVLAGAAFFFAPYAIVAGSTLIVFFVLKRTKAAPALLVGLTALVLAGTTVWQFADRFSKVEGDAAELQSQLGSFLAAYDGAKGDLQEKAAFEDARAFDTAFFARRKTLTGWRGYVDRASSSTVSIRLTKSSRTRPKVTFKHDLGAGDAALSPGHAATLAHLGEDDCIIFSGTPDPGEKSLTQSGAMGSPEYAIHLTSVAKCP